MINFQESYIEEAAIHLLQKNSDDILECLYSQNALKLDDQLSKFLSKFAFGTFKEEQLYKFTHHNAIEFNELKVISDKVFKGQDFFELSKHIAKHMEQSTSHQGIKNGYIIILAIENIVLDDELTSGYAIFKNEGLEDFMNINSENLKASILEGLPSNKVHKAALILNTFSEDGYRLSVIDKNAGNGELAKYWKDDFLKITESQSDIIFTKNFIEYCKEFSESVFEEDQKEEKIKFVRKSFEILGDNEEISPSNFQKQVLDDFPGLEEKAQQFKPSVFVDLAPDEDVKINKNALNQAKRQFKGIIKLDKQVEIKILGGDNFIKKGYDEVRGQHFYQIFFNLEE